MILSRLSLPTIPLPVLLPGLMLVIIAIAPLLPLADPIATDLVNRFAAPALAHPLGLDEYGRDLFSRLIWAMRGSLSISLLASLIAALIGICAGVIAGFYRSFGEMLTMRFMDVVLCFPPLLLAVMAVTLYGPGPVTLIPSLAIVFVPGFTRVAHASMLSVRSQDYVEASRAMGAGTLRLMFLTLLPNIAGPLFVQFSFTIASSIVLESGLSFLGLGIVPPTPSLGLMIGSGRALLAQAPLLLVWPCVALTIMILIINMFCDWLREHFDPRSST